MKREDYQDTLQSLSHIAEKLDMQAVRNNDEHAREFYLETTQLIKNIKEYITTQEKIESVKWT